jgi:hypothetical protein
MSSSLILPPAANDAPPAKPLQQLNIILPSLGPVGFDVEAENFEAVLVWLEKNDFIDGTDPVAKKRVRFYKPFIGICERETSGIAHVARGSGIMNPRGSS